MKAKSPIWTIKTVTWPQLLLTVFGVYESREYLLFRVGHPFRRSPVIVPETSRPESSSFCSAPVQLCYCPLVVTV